MHAIGSHCIQSLPSLRSGGSPICGGRVSAGATFALPTLSTPTRTPAATRTPTPDTARHLPCLLPPPSLAPRARLAPLLPLNPRARVRDPPPRTKNLLLKKVRVWHLRQLEEVVVVGVCVGVEGGRHRHRRRRVHVDVVVHRRHAERVVVGEGVWRRRVGQVRVRRQDGGRREGRQGAAAVVGGTRGEGRGWQGGGGGGESGRVRRLCAAGLGGHVFLFGLAGMVRSQRKDEGGGGGGGDG